MTIDEDDLGSRLKNFKMKKSKKNLVKILFC